MSLFDPRIFLMVTTGLYAAGAIRCIVAGDWPMAMYQGCAAGLQLAVLSMGGK